ncbi:MAG: hypothetical protein RIC52_03425 [Amphiplicatus sp.]
MAEFFTDWWWALLLSFAFIAAVSLRPARSRAAQGSAGGGGTAGASVESCGGDGGGD